MSRTDDVINTAGHRLSTGAMEEVLAAHQDVAECAVVGIADEPQGQVPIGLAVLKAGSSAPTTRSPRSSIARVRDESAPWRPSRPPDRDRLPKTRSGKILRGTIRKMADGEE